MTTFIEIIVIETLFKDIAILASADIYNYVKIAKMAKFKYQKSNLKTTLKSQKLVYRHLNKLPAGLQSFRILPL